MVMTPTKCRAARVAVLRHLIETPEPKGKDVSEHRRMLEAADRLRATPA
jgi:hypothetical protein